MSDKSMFSKQTVTCNCSDIPPTMPTYRTHHLPICPVWAFENRANVVGEVKETVTLQTSKNMIPPEIAEARAALSSFRSGLWTTEYALRLYEDIIQGFIDRHSPVETSALQLREVPSAWMRGVKSYVPGEPDEWDTEFSYGDDKPEGEGWIPLYSKPPHIRPSPEETPDEPTTCLGIIKDGICSCGLGAKHAGKQPEKAGGEPAREYEHTCCKCGKKFTSPHPPGGVSFCGYGCT